MDKVENLAEIVRREVEWYAFPGLNSTTYFVTDDARQVYAVLDVPDAPRKQPSLIVLMARVMDELVFIEEDLHDKPLLGSTGGCRRSARKNCAGLCR